MSKHVSMIHPNLYNQALTNHGIDFLTVSDGDEGLVVTISDESTIQDVAGALVNLAALRHVEHDLVLPSNVSRIHQVVQEIEYALDSGQIDAETREGLDEAVETLRGVAENLNNLDKD